MSNKENSHFNYGFHELNEAAKWVIEIAGKDRLWCFKGEMGAGKTTLIASICKELNVVGDVNSPTFSLVNEYTTREGDIVYHFDFYRIKSIQEVYDIGFETYFDSGKICLIEWPEKIDSILVNEPSRYFEIQLAVEARVITAL
jgi:tRNA threonylcarbamoyladenosine biosynthesis protein TsaE